MKAKWPFLTAAIVAATLAAGCGKSGSKQTSYNVQQLERGRYLVTALACNDCHTPMKMTDHGPEPDMSRMLSGHPEAMRMPPPPKLPDGPWLWLGGATNTAFAGPWGVSYAFNLTPDQNTGLGIWTEDMFIRAIRTGRHMGTSRQIMPPMPWPAFRNLNDEDLKSVYAYLRSIPPVRNQVPAAIDADELALNKQ